MILKGSVIKSEQNIVSFFVIASLTKSTELKLSNLENPSV